MWCVGVGCGVFVVVGDGCVVGRYWWYDLCVFDVW